MSDERSRGDEAQWLNDMLDQVVDKPLPPHLAARLAEVPARHPRASGRGAGFWSWGGGLSWLSWGAAAVLGTAIGLVDTAGSDPELASTGLSEEVGAEAWLEESEQSVDEWQQLAEVALGTDWDGEL